MLARSAILAALSAARRMRGRAGLLAAPLRGAEQACQAARKRRRAGRRPLRDERQREAMDCKRITGSMQIAISRLRDRHRPRRALCERRRRSNGGRPLYGGSGTARTDRPVMRVSAPSSRPTTRELGAKRTARPSTSRPSWPARPIRRARNTRRRPLPPDASGGGCLGGLRQGACHRGEICQTPDPA